MITGAGARWPVGVEVYALTAGGRAGLLDGTGRADLLAADSAAGRVLPFIDEGQRARYFVGDRHTSPERPSNATYKLGIVGPHTAFTPHAHGGEHFVLSLGYAACGLYDDARQEPVTVRLTPGMMIRIPALMPHSFANRSGAPLLILAANTGYGIDHEDYAITAEEAERRAARPAGHDPDGLGPAGLDPAGLDHLALAKALRSIDDAGTRPGVTARERLAGRLRRLAERLEGHR